MSQALPSFQPAWEPAPRRSFWNEYGRHLALFAATAASIYLAGGMALVVGLMSILLAHEMGHYVACRYYGVDATLPFLIPALWIPLAPAVWIPLPMFGTFGAVIRIRGRIPHRRALFDIGIAGPLAGFAVCLPVLYLGILEGHWVQPDPSGGPMFGDPLLLRWTVEWLKGPGPAESVFGIGSLGLAAWFGLFVTALNLIPIGQFDGGHVTYALFRKRAHAISRIAWWLAVGLIYFAPSWVLWAIVARLLGRRHPPTFDDDASVGRGRALVGLLGLAVFVVCFVPSPILGSWRTLGESLGLTSR